MMEPTLEDFLQRAIVWPHPNSESGWVNLVTLRPLVMSAAATIAACFFAGCVQRTQQAHRGVQRPLYRALHVASRLRCTALHAEVFDQESYVWAALPAPLHGYQASHFKLTQCPAFCIRR